MSLGATPSSSTFSRAPKKSETAIPPVFWTLWPSEHVTLHCTGAGRKVLRRAGEGPAVSWAQWAFDVLEWIAGSPHFFGGASRVDARSR